MTLAIADDRLDDTFAALANSTRRAILARLAQGEANVNELAAPFDMTLPAVSKHLKVLERAGLVVRGRKAQYRPCSLDAAPLEEISSWAEQYRPVWEARFDRMNEYVKALQPDERQGQPMAEVKGAEDAVVIEQILDGPLQLIWQMWTEPEHFKRWYGPTGATIPVAEMDVRVRGRRLVCMAMETPNGAMQMWFTGEYREVVPNVRLVYTESMCDENGNVLEPSTMGMPDGHPATTEITVELEDLGDHTKMVMTHAGVPEGSPGAAGWNMAFGKLAAYVAMQRR